MEVASTTRPWLGPLYDSAVETLDRNVIQDAIGTFIRAGGGYADPWTRDAALNSWGAASILRPDIARATLLRVCDRLPDGRPAVAQDDQWWDQIVWVLAAWDLAATTGDVGFLRTAWNVGRATVEILHRDRFRPPWGLYAGPALMQDGISGLPTPPATSDEPSSFVLDYPEAHEIMALSTNVLYVAAYRCLDDMARALGEDACDFAGQADRLTDAIRRHLADGDTFGYFVHGSGDLAGTLDRHREASGLALAAMFGVAPPGAAAAVLGSVGRGPAGAVNVAPHFADRYSDERPGRHNAMCWPMVMGLVGLASSVTGDAGGATRVLEDFRALVSNSGGRFDEVYDALTGNPSGGWQCGRRWNSEPDQTWSATSFLRLVHFGLLGMRPQAAGLSFRPSRPEHEIVTALDLPYRDATLDVTVEPGERFSVWVDGRDVTRSDVHVPGDITGHHTVRVTVSE